MYSRATAFVVRSLRQESRLISHHVMRAVLALMLLLLFLGRAATYSMSAGVGGVFASSVLTCCYWFVTLLGGLYFCTAIVEEKEEQTLPLLRMTGASPAAILLGKSTPRLASVLVLLLVITPFLMLAVTLGGVLLKGLVTAALGILAYAIMFCQLGLLTSVVSRDARRAFSRTLFLWAFIEFFPGWCSLGSYASGSLKGYVSNSGAQSAMEWLSVELSWLSGWTDNLVLYGNLQLYLADFSDAGLWRPQMTAHLILAVVLFFLSWLLFEPCTARALGEAHDSPRKSSRRTRRVRRPWGRALVWKSWQHLAGGWLWLILRLVGPPLLAVGIVYGISAAVSEKVIPEVLSAILMLVGVVVFVGNTAILFGRLFNSEIQDKTLGMLLMLPLSRNSLLAQSVLGLVPAVVATTSCVVIGMIVLMTKQPDVFQRMVDEWSVPWICELLAWGLATIYFGLFLSIRLRHGGMLLAIVVFWMLGPILVGSGMGVCSVVFGATPTREFMEHVLPMLLIAIQLVFCFWIHRMVIRSLSTVAEQE